MILSLFITVILTIGGCSSEFQLKQLHVLFRHGDRTPSAGARFPTDPNYDSDFYPMGIGGLTNAGKLRSYEFGKFLHQKYNSFLGDVYSSNLLEARSTDYDRTKMSLQLVLAGLFPPKSKQKWHDTLDWQPIPFTYVSKIQDDLLTTVYHTKFKKEKERVTMEREIQGHLNDMADFMSELSNLTGRNIYSSFDMKQIYETLYSESMMNLSLPQWTSEVFPDGKLLDGILLDYYISTYDTNITNSLIGKFVTKITTDILTAKNITSNARTKLYLYSGHEINIIGLLNALNVLQLHVPDYSSAVIIEILEKNRNYFVKVVYYQGSPDDVIELNLPGCSAICPLEKYLDIVDEILRLAAQET